MAVYKSLGGKNLDERTIQVWYSMLRHIKDKHWEPAVIAVTRSERNLAVINFVEAIETVVKGLVRKELMDAQSPKLLPEEKVDAEVVRAFVKKFTAKMEGKRI